VRTERGLLQKEVAQEIGVLRGTINKWERNRGEPRAADVPRILTFLGYDPLPEAESLEQQMGTWRLRNGLSARAAARKIGVGQATWAAWERGTMMPGLTSRKTIIDILGTGR